MRTQQGALQTGHVLRELLHHVACVGDSGSDLQGLQLSAAGVFGAGRLLYTSCVWHIATAKWLPGCVLQPSGAVLNRGNTVFTLGMQGCMFVT
jgi:hypothetical protein